MLMLVSVCLHVVYHNLPCLCTSVHPTLPQAAENIHHDPHKWVLDAPLISVTGETLAGFQP